MNIHRQDEPEHFALGGMVLAAVLSLPIWAAIWAAAKAVLR